MVRAEDVTESRVLTIAVVVPAYNEEIKIRAVIETMPETVAHVFVVDDASSDGTAGVVREIAARDSRVSLLEHAGNSLLSARGDDARLEVVDEPQLQPGWLEGSGTDAIHEMVQLIEAQRAFESYQKLISLTMNEVNRRAVHDIVGA